MSTESTPNIDDEEERTKWSLWAILAAAVLVLLFGVIAAGTLRGCFYTDPLEAAKTEEEKKKEEERKKEGEIAIAAPLIQPSETDSPFQPVKPGHWAATSQKMRANYRDFVGDSRISIVNSNRAAYAVPYTPFVLRGSRPVLLTKGRPKFTESTLFVPPTDQALLLSTMLEERGLGLSIRSENTLTRMPSYQYHFVVLAKEPTRYAYVKSLDSVKVPFDGESDSDDTEDPLHYRVALVDISQSIPLSDNPLTWTSVAYMLWDEVDPELFTTEQERALVDWLHWGGQLIVSGPDSLDLLKDSFLAPYMPAASAGPRTIAADDAALIEFNQGWTISTNKVPAEPLKPTAPWSAVKLDIHAEAQPLPNAGELFAERQVGRGRIVVSAMQLAERDLVNWRSGFESFFNACLLRRPPREFREGFFGDVTLAWSDPALVDRRLDARLNTNVRYLARDLGVETAYRFEEVFDQGNQFPQFNRFGQQEILREYKAPDAAGGIGAWNDFSLSANAARETLREAAGVEVPDAGFVVMCLAAYLIALVPLNWLVFHTLGRVEWAWIAAPIIAIAGTVIVVQRAQLDIGFVRAQTEVALLEQQPDHPRALLSRFTALYTSLSTTYDLEFGNLTTLAAPFPSQADYRLLSGQDITSVDFLRYDNVRLAGVPISSNSTGMVHSEQMITLDGPIRLGKSSAGGSQIENRSKFVLRSACVVRRPTRAEIDQDGRRFEGRFLGQLLPGQSLPFSERMTSLPTDRPAFVQERLDEARVQGGQPLNLEPMFKLALDPKYIDEGETRLVARVDEVMPGQAITPEASQIRGATFVVAHLRYAPPPPPQKDRNTKRDFKADADDPEEDEQFEF
jgi:hypothetical protein